jgi:hypothetical protein
VPGVIGKKPIHLLKDDERKKVAELKDLHIDIGANDADEARGLVRIGDVAVISGEPLELPTAARLSRSMDNRLAATSPTRRRGSSADAGGAPGRRGRRRGRPGGDDVRRRGDDRVPRCKPDLAIVVDVTHATDAPGIDVNELGSHAFGSGPVIERGSNLNPRVFELLYDTAEAEGIPFTSPRPAATRAPTPTRCTSRAAACRAARSAPAALHALAGRDGRPRRHRRRRARSSPRPRGAVGGRDVPALSRGRARRLQLCEAVAPARLRRTRDLQGLLVIRGRVGAQGPGVHRPHPKELSGMVRKLPALLAALLAAIGAGALAVTLSSGSSHREAPLSSVDPTADDTDVYAFKAADAPNALTIVANWIPFEDPAGRPELLPARRPRGVLPQRRQHRRRPARRALPLQVQARACLDKNSFLYALPGVASIRDPKLNVQQTVLGRARVVPRRQGDRATRPRHDLPVAPNNVGPKTFPNYAAVAGAASRHLDGGGRVFVGQADDPFFVDLGTTFDAINIRKGPATRAAARTTSPATTSTRSSCRSPSRRDARPQPVSGPKAPNAVVGVWASTNRERVAVSAAPGFGPSTKTLRDEGAKGQDEGEVQVSRLGNPLVNEVVIPLGEKDRFNATQPSDDLKNFGKYVLSPQLAKVINVLFPGLNVPETNRTDIVQALLTGIPGLTQIRPARRRPTR